MLSGLHTWALPQDSEAVLTVKSPGGPSGWTPPGLASKGRACRKQQRDGDGGWRDREEGRVFPKPRRPEAQTGHAVVEEVHNRAKIPKPRSRLQASNCCPPGTPLGIPQRTLGSREGGTWEIREGEETGSPGPVGRITCTGLWLGMELLSSEHISAALNMPESLENSAVATGQEKVGFHSSPKKKTMPKNVQTTAQVHSSHTLAK